jgi:hypothetical protein
MHARKVNEEMLNSEPNSSVLLSIPGSVLQAQALIEKVANRKAVNLSEEGAVR